MPVRLNPHPAMMSAPFSDRIRMRIEHTLHHDPLKHDGYAITTLHLILPNSNPILDFIINFFKTMERNDQLFYMNYQKN